MSARCSIAGGGAEGTDWAWIRCRVGIALLRLADHYARSQQEDIHERRVFAAVRFFVVLRAAPLLFFAPALFVVALRFLVPRPVVFFAPGGEGTLSHASLAVADRRLVAPSSCRCN